MINKIFDKKYGKYEKKTYIESEKDNFLEKCQDENISASYSDGDDKNKFNTEKITKSLKKLRNKLINLSEFKEKFKEDYKSKKRKVVFLQTKKN